MNDISRRIIQLITRYNSVEGHIKVGDSEHSSICLVGIISCAAIASVLKQSVLQTVFAFVHIW